MESFVKTKKRKREDIEEVKVYKFNSSFNGHHYEIIVEDGKLIKATYEGYTMGRVYHDEYYDYEELDSSAIRTCRSILEYIIFLGDIEDLRNIYGVLNDGPIKNMVKELQNELISKLTF